MPNRLYTQTQVSKYALAALRHNSLLARLIRADVSTDFSGAVGTTVNIKGPAHVGTARKYTDAERKAGTAITYDDITGTDRPVTITSRLYKAVKLPDEDVTFRIDDLAREVIRPSAEAVVDGVETELVKVLLTAKGVTNQDKGTDNQYFDTTDKKHDSLTDFDNEASLRFNGIGLALKYTDADLTVNNRDEIEDAILTARNLLTARGVEKANRYLAVGANASFALNKLKVLNSVAHSGASDTLREAEIGRYKGFTVIEVPGLGVDDMIAFHADAVGLALRVPKPPRGAGFATTVSQDGYALSYIEDYDPDHLQDRAVTSVFIGASLLDFQRAVKFTLKTGFHKKAAPASTAPAPGA